MDTEMGVDEAPLDKGSEATEIVSAGELTPQTSAEPLETFREHCSPPIVNIRPTPVCSNESSETLTSPALSRLRGDLSTYTLHISEAFACHWSKIHDTHANEDKKLLLYYCKYIDDSRARLQFQCQLQGSMDYEEVVFDLDQLYSINFCIAHSYLQVTWTPPSVDGSDYLTTYSFDKSSGKAFYDFLVEDLKDSGCRFSMICEQW